MCNPKCDFVSLPYINYRTKGFQVPALLKTHHYCLKGN